MRFTLHDNMHKIVTYTNIYYLEINITYILERDVDVLFFVAHPTAASRTPPEVQRVVMRKVHFKNKSAQFSSTDTYSNWSFYSVISSVISIYPTVPNSKFS
jgi:hypothetical protein